MSKISNITDVRFGSLVTVEPTSERKNGYTIWKCLCDCGRVTYASSRHLKNGWTTSCEDPDCPYQQASMKMSSRCEDLTGKRFGKLTVLAKANEKSSTGRVLWNCLCDCGGKVITSTGQLKAGYRKSCGCLSRPPRKNWIGKTFGSLTVTAYDGKRDGKHYWKCLCTCGNGVSVCQSSLKSGHTTSCGCRNKPYASLTLVDGTCIESLRGAVEKKTVARNNSSGVRGVYRNKKNGRWCAQITFKGRTKYLGSFETLKEAKLARKRGEKIFEEFLETYDSGKSPTENAPGPFLSSHTSNFSMCTSLSDFKKRKGKQDITYSPSLRDQKQYFKKHKRKQGITYSPSRRDQKQEPSNECLAVMKKARQTTVMT